MNFHSVEKKATEFVAWWTRLGLEDDAIWRRVVVIVSMLSVAAIFIEGLNHDVAWHLYAAKAMAAGDRLYVDILEYNPPLIYVLNLVPVLIGKLLSLKAHWIFNLLVIALCFFSLGICASVLRPFDSSMSRSLKRILLLTGLYALASHAGFQFGQREHLTTILMLPFILCAATRAEKMQLGSWLYALVGFMAGIGLLLKPQYMLVLVALEAYLLISKRIWPWKRLELWVAGSVGASYILLVFLAFPEYFELARRAVSLYAGFDVSVGETLAESFGPAALALILALILPVEEKTKSIRWVLTLATAASLLIGITYLKGWSYHFYTSRALGMLLMALLVMTLLDRPPESANKAPYKSMVALAVVILILASALQGLSVASRRMEHWKYSEQGRLTELLSQDPGVQVLFLSTSIFPAFPVLNFSAADWATRFPFLWPLPGLYPNGFEPRSESQMNENERWFRDIMVEDFISREPVYVIADQRVRKQGFGELPFDFVKYLTQDPRFAAQWAKYEFETIAGSYAIYRIQDRPRLQAGSADRH